MDKIDLENLIYYRAALELATIYNNQGRLLVKQASVLLRALLGIYNRFFAAENKSLENQSYQQEQAFYVENQKQFVQEQTRYPLKNSFHLP